MTFCARFYRELQTRGTNHHYIDLLFYHRGLRCLVAIDLKVEAFKRELLELNVVQEENTDALS